MLIPDHPHDERLSALASGDPEATADASLTEHLAACARCTDTVGELSALRASLAELPDLRPHRPLRILPEVADAPSRADRLGGWARRFFAPALTAGAALAMVGLVGTASPAFDNFAASGGASAGSTEEPAAMQREGAEDAASIAAAPGGAAAEGYSVSSDGAENEPEVLSGAGDDADRLSLDDEATQEALPAERSPWPMVLFSGVAIMIAAALLRWILAPRAD